MHLQTLVCKIMLLFYPNTCYTEFGCHVIEYKGMPFSVVNPNGTIRQTQGSEPILVVGEMQTQQRQSSG